MNVIYIIKFIILACNIVTIYSVDNTKLSDKRSCADKECSVPISAGKTLTSFPSPTPGILSFLSNEKVTIYSKEAGENTNLWGAEISGKRGYVPKTLVREDKIFVKGAPTFLENIEEALDRKGTPNINPDAVKEPYEVIDGTTVYTGNSNEILPGTENVNKVVINSDTHQDDAVTEEIFKLKSDSDVSLVDSFKVTLDKSHVVNDVVINENNNSGSLVDTKSEQIKLTASLNEDQTEHIVDTNDDTHEAEVAEMMQNVHIPKTDNEIKNSADAGISASIDTKESGVKAQVTIENSTKSKEENTFLNKENSFDSLQSITEKTVEPKVDVNHIRNETFQETNQINAEIKSIITENTDATDVADNPIVDSSILNNSLFQEKLNDDEMEAADFGLNLEVNAESDLHEIDNNTIEQVTDEINNIEKSNESTDEIEEYDYASKPQGETSDNLHSDQMFSTLSQQIPANSFTENEYGRFFSNMLSHLFSRSSVEDDSNLSNVDENFANIKDNIIDENSIYNEAKSSLYEESEKDYLLSNIDVSDSCSSTGELNNCRFHPESLEQTTEQNLPYTENISNSLNTLDFANFFDIILVLSITGGTTSIFFIAYLLIDKCRREGPLIAKINLLEKALLVSRKENVLLAEKHQAELINMNLFVDQKDTNQEIENLQVELQKSLIAQTNLQDQILSLEKELENSTEVGLELNKMISDMLSSQNGSDVLTQHVEQLQVQLVGQHNDIAKYKDTLNEKTTENHELQLELDINKKKVNDLQSEIDNMVLNVLKIGEDRDEKRQKFENSLAEVNEKFQEDNLKFNAEFQRLNSELQKANKLTAELNRNLEIKSKELDLFKDSMKEVKSMKSNSETLKSLLDMSSVKAELHQLKTDNVALNNTLQNEHQKTYTFEKQAEIAIQEAKLLKVRFDEADKDRMEAQTKLQVLASYFKEKENQLQKELSKHEAIWNEKQGEASSTVERIKFMQEELQNYKSQNETLKHEIMSQEVDLKSQISVLEKKSHEYWLNARQVERKLEDAKQEAAQLRNRLTLQERSYLNDKTNGTMEHALSPLHHMGGIDHHNDVGLIIGGDSTASPPPSMLYGGVHREHMASSPHNLHSLPPPPPFLPPPMFMPPPPMNGPPPPLFMHHGMPPPPLTQGSSSMFGPPGDHRPPPLGRISSPPLPNRVRNRSSDCYSPSTGRAYSPYDRRHTPPSPSYDDDDDDDMDDDDIYRRGDRRYYDNSYRGSTPSERQMHKATAKNGPKGSTMSSGGSANSNTSAEKGNLNTSDIQYYQNTNV